jgi:Arc/MetJ-type ribon-helix-helix transcriptional regulator
MLLEKEEQPMTVSTGRRRAHVVMPEDLLREIDARVGQRRRSEFIQEAIEEKLARLCRVEAFERVVGSLKDVDVPGWETPEAAARWVHDLRHYPENLAEHLADRDS